MTSGIRHRVRRLARLSAGEARLLLEAQRTLVICQLARWFRPKGKLVGVQSARTGTAAEPEQLTEADRVGWAVTRAAEFGLFRPRCLVRALAMQRMLRRRGIRSSAIRIGVRPEGGTMRAHAWVELDDSVIGDSVEHVRSFTTSQDLRLGGL